MENVGRLVVFIGIILIIVGLVISFFGRIPLLGKLPGDIHIKWGNVRVYLPLATSLLISIVLTIILWFVSRIRGQ